MTEGIPWWTKKQRTRERKASRSQKKKKKKGKDEDARPAPVQSGKQPPSIEEIDTDEIMAAFRQTARGQGWKGRDELLKEVSLAPGLPAARPQDQRKPCRGRVRGFHPA